MSYFDKPYWTYSSTNWRAATTLGCVIEDKNGDVYMLCRAAEDLMPGEPCGHAPHSPQAYVVEHCDPESLALVGVPLKSVKKGEYFWILNGMAGEPSVAARNAFSVAHLERCLKL